jgi:hypothetical protein
MGYLGLGLIGLLVLMTGIGGLSTLGEAMSKLMVIPLELEEANRVVSAWHRHHQPTVGHRFSLGVVDNLNIVHGAIIVGRPVARLAGDPRDVLEVTRLVSDGTKNVCSMLYSAAARAGREMGYTLIQTYILADEETGTSLKASGWTCEGIAGGGKWKHTDGKERRTDQPTGKKTRWSKQLFNRESCIVVLPSLESDLQLNLLGEEDVR